LVPLWRDRYTEGWKSQLLEQIAMSSHVAPPPAAAAGIEAQIELARQAAIEVFGNCVGVELMQDPECSRESWYVVDVEDRVVDGDFKGSIQREFRWHERVRELIPDALDRFCLSVIPRE
jgi:hypothetical protein